MSRVRRIGVSGEDFITSATARAVSEFFEKSPRKRAKFEPERELRKSRERLNEPDSVDSKNSRFSRDGSCFLRESGKRFFMDFMKGKDF